MADYLNQFMSKVQLIQTEIQKKIGSSGTVINTSDLTRGLRAEEKNNDSGNESSSDDLSNDMKKFFYTSPVNFYKNHKKNVEEFIDKHISKPIDNLSGDSDR